MLPLPLQLLVELFIVEEFALELLIGRELPLHQGLRVLVLPLDVTPTVDPRLVLRDQLLIQGRALLLAGPQEVLGVAMPLLLRVKVPPD